MQGPNAIANHEERIRALEAKISAAIDGAGTVVAVVAGPPNVHTHRSVVDYGFAPDAAPGAPILAGNHQGNTWHSGPLPETAILLLVDAETAPGAAGLPITIQYAATNDLGSPGAWTDIATVTLSSANSTSTASMVTATIPANRLIRMNVGTIVGAPKDATITLRVTRPVAA